MNALAHEPASLKRQHIQVIGIVQGVGFRPFVYRLAADLGLVGFVRNDGAGVTIEIEGAGSALEAFRQALIAQPPALARIDSLTAAFIPPGGDPTFTITESTPGSTQGSARNILISPDVALCDECLHELLDPSDRRFRYPFINCTDCGPRFTILLDTPYDRDKTTMRDFAMCPDCEAEYRDPLNRRFHAQPNACPTCGPNVTLLDPSSTSADASDPIASVAQQLAAGAIVALKGLGGFHLACDALNPSAVRQLRRRKQREAKPFALMVPDLETAKSLCVISDAEAALLQSRRRPIVLLQQRHDCPISPDVAPHYNTLGLMLPYTPLHTLVLRDFAARVGANRVIALVMTSGNLSSEPIVYRNDDAEQRLSAIADTLLIHNRDIHSHCDDSVTRIVAGKPQMLRRSRGYVPEPITVGQRFAVPILAVGGQLKNVFCLGSGDRAFLSQHVGDLENMETFSAFRDGIDHFQRLFDIDPQVVGYDLHPDYLATKYALALDVPHKIGVQHHHAHIASVLVEHGLTGPVIGVVADGTGYGPDGTLWGGEIMIADLGQYERVAHLSPVPLPGGEQAIRQPWRMAAVYLQHTYGDAFLSLDIPFVRRLDDKRWTTLAQMIARRLNSPHTSSLGRLFDAVAALLGLRDEVVYEGQAAIELEMVAEAGETAYPFEIGDTQPMQLDVRPMIQAIVKDIQHGASVSLIAGRFHRAVAEMLLAACCHVRRQTGLEQVAVSGGVFQNRLLLEQMLSLLDRDGFRSYINRQVPPNDGGLSLGQAAVAATLCATHYK